jgi:hypothetical protein
MKPLILSVALLLTVLFSLPSSAQKRVGWTSFTATNNHTVATNFVTGTNIFATKVTIMGLKSAGVNNAGTVYIGPVSNATYFAISAGGTAVIEPDPGSTFNLKDWYFRTPSTNDGIFVIYH